MPGYGRLTMHQPWDLVRIQRSSFDVDMIDVSSITKPDQIEFRSSYTNKEIVLRYYGHFYKPGISDNYDLGRFSLVKYVNDDEIIIKPIRINNKGISFGTSDNCDDGNTFEEYVCTIRQNITKEEVHAIIDFYKRIKYTKHFVEGTNSLMLNPAHYLSGKQIQTVMTTINEIFFNAPHTTIKWSDGTITTVKCTDNEEFNKEIGLAMAISKKYFEASDPNHPRAMFKTAVKTATDQTEKTAAKRAYKFAKKQKSLKAAKNEKDSNNE